jgi:hypothetical protein
MGIPIQGLDPECVALVDAMNHYPGIMTTCSCCGHGKDAFTIYFHVSDMKNLPRMLYWVDGLHTGCYGWQVVAYTDCVGDQVFWKLTSEGPDVFHHAEIIAKHMLDDAIELAGETS